MLIIPTTHPKSWFTKRALGSVNGVLLCVTAQPLCVRIALTLTDASTDGILNQ
jgi:hypothetical protein